MTADPPQLDLLDEVIRSVSQVSGAGVCIYDLRQFLQERYKRVVDNHHGHRCTFCGLIRALPGGYQACLRSDTKNAVALAEQYKQPFFHTCHAGITEIVIPILRQHEMIAVAFCGQCRLQGETRWEMIFSRTKPYNPDPAVLKQAFKELPIMDRKKLSATATLLDTSLRYLVETVGWWKLDYDHSSSHTEDPIDQSLQFIAGHYHEGIRAGDVARFVHLHPSYLARIFKKRMGHSISQQIAFVRIEHARTLLTCTSIPIYSIASNVGYTSYTQFASTFRKLTGKTPIQFRAS